MHGMGIGMLLGPFYPSGKKKKKNITKIRHSKTTSVDTVDVAGYDMH